MRSLLPVCLALACLAASGCKPAPAPAPEELSVNREVEPTTKIESPRVVDSMLDHVLVVENANSPTSIEISQYYRKKRGVKKVISIRCPDSALNATNETLDFAAYLEAIEKPLWDHLSKDTKIDYIVLTKGIPIRLSSAPVGFAPGRPSLDSCLAAIDYFRSDKAMRVTIVENDLKGTGYVNKFWNSSDRFSHDKNGGYLVTRLDGYTAAAAMSLVDSALAAEKSKPTGTILLDSMALADPVDISSVPYSPIKIGMKDLDTIVEMGWGEWNVDLFAAHSRLSKFGIPVELDRTESFLGNRKSLMGYASWGSNDAKFVAANYSSLRFDAGAIAETAVSTSARTFLPTSGGQSLIADLIEARVTGVKGYCDEPFLLAIASPTILFDRYARGWNLAESFYAASRFIGWEDIIIGDPLCAPYASAL